MENKSVLKIDSFGVKRWKLNGKFHREDGPAIEYPNGDKFWYYNGFHHRMDGPAVTQHGIDYWLIYDHDITEKITKWAEELGIDLDNLTEVDKALIKIVWADYDEEI